MGQTASEQVMDVKRLYDLKVSKARDLMTGNLLLSGALTAEMIRLFGCTDLTHGNTFTLFNGCLIPMKQMSRLLFTKLSE